MLLSSLCRSSDCFSTVVMLFQLESFNFTEQRGQSSLVDVVVVSCCWCCCHCCYCWCCCCLNQNPVGSCHSWPPRGKSMSDRLYREGKQLNSLNGPVWPVRILDVISSRPKGGGGGVCCPAVERGEERSKASAICQ